VLHKCCHLGSTDDRRQLITLSARVRVQHEGRDAFRLRQLTCYNWDAFAGDTNIFRMANCLLLYLCYSLAFLKVIFYLAHPFASNPTM